MEDIRFFKAYACIKEWKTLYIGGGTPSLLAADDIYTLITSIRREQKTPFTECTIEANPEDITPDWLAACRSSGVTRISIGVQSFNTAVLAANGRRGSKEKTVQALNTIKQAWTGDLSCDLIAGLTGQSAQSLADDVRHLIDYGVEHVSLYGLSSTTPLPQEREDFIYELLQNSMQILVEKEYVRYEVSNFSYKDKHRSAHNEMYWNMEPYVGIGPTACGTLVYEHDDKGFLFAERFEGIKDTYKWMHIQNRADCYKREDIDRKTFLEEVILMGFRLTEGIRRAAFIRRFGVDITMCIGKTLLRWEKKGQCCINSERVYLTDEGLLFLNRFLLEAFTELDTPS